MGWIRHACRNGADAVCLAAAAALLATASLDAHAQAGALYRCAANDFTNTLSEEQAIERHCAKIGNAEWVFSGSDAAGRQYTYNDRRTVVRGDGTVETWLQVVVPQRADADLAARQALAYVKTVSPQLIRCRERTVSSGATYFLDMRDNSVVKDSGVRSALFPPPERVAEALVRQLCVDRHAGESSLASR